MPDQNTNFFHIAIQRSVMIRAARIATVVGLILAVINHGDTLVSGQATLSTWFKIVLTFLVPFGVSTFSSVLAVRERMQMVEPMK
ncbi:MAG: nitrate/nitrite transporter NrtS [Pseudomonadota bacterium]